MSEDSLPFDIQRKNEKPLRKSSRTKSDRMSAERAKDKAKSAELRKESDSYTPLESIYWTRLLEILETRKKEEDDYKSDPKRYTTHEEDYSDFGFEGLMKDALTTKLKEIVSNSGLKSKDYNDVLELLMDPVAPYVNRYPDKNGKFRYRITLLGELALEQIEKDKILSGFWNIVKKTKRASNVKKIK